MRSVFTVPEAVEWDARYAEACPGRLHLNVCGCGRIENFAARMSGSVGCAGKRALNYREAGSKRACGARANHNLNLFSSNNHEQTYEPMVAISTGCAMLLTMVLWVVITF
jgi:hypothetical protein